MGIRYALGAQRNDVLILIGKLGVGLAGMGLVLGFGLALALNGFMSENFQLFQVTSTDPMTYTAVGILFLCIALLACYVPARRAANVDPMTILRHE